MTMEDAEAVMTQWTQTAFKFEDSPDEPYCHDSYAGRLNGIYLCVDHMTMDAQSLICFLKDIIELYCNKKYEGVPYPTDMSSYIEQIKKDLAYEAGSKAQKRDAEFFEKLIAQSEPIFNDVEGPQRLEEQEKRLVIRH